VIEALLSFHRLQDMVPCKCQWKKQLHIRCRSCVFTDCQWTTRLLLQESCAITNTSDRAMQSICRFCVVWK